MDPTEPLLEGMFNNIDEQNLLFSAITKDSIVLEWGSGKSTPAIAKRCKKLVSIEHNLQWMQDVRKMLEAENITNVLQLHVERNHEEMPGHDGTHRDYAHYVQLPLKLAKERDLQFDIIFIDGRARVACSQVASQILTDGGFIFIHDYKNPAEEYRRWEYEVVEDWLQQVDHKYAMGKFVPKTRQIPDFIRLF